MADNLPDEDDCFEGFDKAILPTSQGTQVYSFLSSLIKGLPNCVSGLKWFAGIVIVVRLAPIVAHFGSPFFSRFGR